MSLTDPRIIKQADILVNYSVKVKKGEKIIISSDFEGKPLALEIYKLLIKKGALEVRRKFGSYEFDKAYFDNAKSNQIEHFPKIEEYEIKNIDCYFRISAPSNTRALSKVDAKKISRRSKVILPLVNYRVEKTRWVTTKYPTEAQAQEADMSLSEYEDFVFGAINNVDWQRVKKQQEVVKKLMERTDNVRIIGKDTDLTLSIKGRRAVNCAGEFNMPDGEVFTSVVENSADGYISFTFPALYMGREFHNIRLEFNRGKVAKAKAGKNEADLNEILNMDRGARFIGELGIGNNFAIKSFTKDILFDEKIGGSVHIALGKGYKETGSKNISALHWDMIKDLRKTETDRNALGMADVGGELWFDDKLVQRNGKWLIKLT